MRKVLFFPRKGCNWERSFPFPGKVATGKGFINFGKGCNWERSFPFPGKDYSATGKGFINLGKLGKGKGKESI